MSTTAPDSGIPNGDKTIVSTVNSVTTTSSMHQSTDKEWTEELHCLCLFPMEVCYKVSHAHRFTQEISLI